MTNNLTKTDNCEYKTDPMAQLRNSTIYGAAQNTPNTTTTGEISHI